MDEPAEKKIVDFMSYKLEKSLKNSGFVVKRDVDKNIKILIKVQQEE